MSTRSLHPTTAPPSRGRPTGPWWVGGTLAVLSLAGSWGLGVAAPAAAVGPALSVAGAAAPAFPGDAPDPDLVRVGSDYFAFTTGTALGNYLQVLVDTSGSPASGYGSSTGKPYGSTALPDPPAWEQPDTQTSPGVVAWGGQWLMYYDAALAGHGADSGANCLSVASAPTLSPSSTTFTDSSTGPLLCQPGGAIDPSPFVDPATGQAYLLWKQNDGGSAAPAVLWSQQLSPDGRSLVGQPSELLTNDTVAYPWEATVEDPDMVEVDGTYTLIFSAGIYTSAGYSEAAATCTGPLGPCGPQAQVLGTSGSVLGPGGGSLVEDPSGTWWLGYAAWQGGLPGCTAYACGATRQLFVAPTSLVQRNPEVPCRPPEGPRGYRFAASDGGVFSYGNLPFCGSMGGIALDQPVVGMADTPSGGGYWEVAADGGIFSFGDAGFFGSMGGRALAAPIVGMAATPDGRGYWEVAADGGIFSFGDAGFFGSMGGRALDGPIVGMAAGPGGHGYWLVAADGGVFGFGDATFFGSMGGRSLRAPVVGLAPTPDGTGYWEVGADGGIFSFGDAVFSGSMGGRALDAPVVAFAPSGPGYLEVAADGGVFSFGAPFLGSMGGQPLAAPIVAVAALG